MVAWHVRVIASPETVAWHVRSASLEMGGAARSNGLARQPTRRPSVGRARVRVRPTHTRRARGEAFERRRGTRQGRGGRLPRATHRRESPTPPPVALARSPDTTDDESHRRRLAACRARPPDATDTPTNRRRCARRTDDDRRRPDAAALEAATHFPRLRDATGVRYDRMLFFDDCNWGDHVGAVEAACVERDSGRGVVGHRAPRGLGVDEVRHKITARRRSRHIAPGAGPSTTRPSY